MDLDRMDAQEKHGGMVLERIRKVPKGCAGPELMEKEGQGAKARFPLPELTARVDG